MRTPVTAAMSQMSVNSGGGVQSSQITLYEKNPDLTYGDKGCWARRTKVERILVYVVLLCLALSIGLIIALVIVSNKDSGTEGKGEQKPQVCTTIDCVTAASRVAEKIDFSVDPCEDFYSYACGTWSAKTVIPEDRSEINQFSFVRDEVEVILKNILEDNETYANVEVLNKPKVLYAACLNLEKIEEVGDAPLRALLQKLGGWPLLQSNWDASGFNLTNTLVQLYFMGKDPLFDFYVGTDIKNSTARILSVDQPFLGMPGQKYYLVPRNDTILMAYQTLMLSIAKALGADPSTVQADVEAVVDFEIQLANISVPDEERRTKDLEDLYHLYTLPEMARNFSGPIDWMSFINEIFGDPEVSVGLEAEEPIVNWSPEYFTRLLDLLKDTPNETVANYLIWRLIKSRVTYLSEKYRNYYQEYRKVLSGTSIPRPRFRDCVSYATNSMGLAVGHMFVAKAFDEDAKHMVLEMIAELKKAFNEQLNELDWMDEQTKEVAREKNEYISEKIGYPDEVLNITYLTQFYKNLTVQTDDYFNNVVSHVEYSVRDHLRQLRKPVDKNQWTNPPSTVNAFYSATKNQILFPAGILQPPYFSKTYPKSLNFGGIGMVIGHEITHGFDDRGREYDKDGNLRRWWNDEAVKRFKERAQCIVNQYGNFTVPEINMKMNGVKTKGENIADNGGIKQSYRAYRNWIRETRNGKEEDVLPGLDFTNDQLFFLSYAQVWCSNMRKESAMNRIRSAAHSPGRFRVTGPLQNSEDFARAFNCPKGSYMNPEEKCTVW